MGCIPAAIWPRCRRSMRAMRTALLFIFGVLGLMTLPSYPLIGLLLIGGGYLVHRGAGAADEEGFMAVLMVLAGLGMVVMIIEDIWQRVSAGL